LRYFIGGVLSAGSRWRPLPVDDISVVV